MKQIITLLFLISSYSLNAQNNLTKTFYRGQKGVQYFIKPLKFIDKDKKNVTIDFTLSVRNDSVKNIISNFSISDSSIKYISLDGDRIDVKKLFDDYDSRTFYSRYTMEINIKHLKEILNRKEIEIKDNIYFLKKSLHKKTKLLNQKLLTNVY